MSPATLRSGFLLPQIENSVGIPTLPTSVNIWLCPNDIDRKQCHETTN